MEEIPPFVVNKPSVRSYTQCCALVQVHLKEISQKHGVLKHWCTEKDLDYKAVVKIKNGTLAYYAPKLIQKLLTVIGYRVSITRNFSPEQKVEDLYMITRLETTLELPSPAPTP